MKFVLFVVFLFSFNAMAEEPCSSQQWKELGPQAKAFQKELDKRLSHADFDMVLKFYCFNGKQDDSEFVEKFLIDKNYEIGKEEFLVVDKSNQENVLIQSFGSNRLNSYYKKMNSWHKVLPLYLKLVQGLSGEIYFIEIRGDELSGDSRVIYDDHLDQTLVIISYTEA